MVFPVNFGRYLAVARTKRPASQGIEIFIFVVHVVDTVPLARNAPRHRGLKCCCLRLFERVVIRSHETPRVTGD